MRCLGGDGALFRRDLRLWVARGCLDSEPAAGVGAVVAAGEAVAFGAECSCGSISMLLLAALPSEEFGGPWNQWPGRAFDRGAFEGPPVEPIVYQHLTSAGTPHCAELSWSGQRRERGGVRGGAG